jgi:hypothetical protein
MRLGGRMNWLVNGMLLQSDLQCKTIRQMEVKLVEVE